ncbi:hypothetical protein [Pseudoalteromonas viridis]|uniref:Secreted protein n=1 Tax=Pseudoalteromonas viridis TaxID=339617 RepID=A0ABX7VB55_9GAMM|nr:hypothetical protein [Pseudoalteromonas viridis]QTL37695.1 hypothetical protein J5X90_22925 [Pseudoalteromonas viridis]
MKKAFITTLLCLSTLYASAASAAGKTGELFFRSNGEEIHINRLVSNSGKVTSVSLRTRCPSVGECKTYSQKRELFENLLRAIKDRQLYTYVEFDYDPCRGDPHNPCQPEGVGPERIQPFNEQYSELSVLQEDAIIQRTREVPTPKQDNALTTLYNSVVAAVGTVSITKLTDYLFTLSNDGKVRTNVLVTGRYDGREQPISYCKMVSGGRCINEEGVTVSRLNSEVIAISYPKGRSDEDFNREHDLYKIMTRLKYACRIAYTGTWPNMVGQMTCHYQPY